MNWDAGRYPHVIWYFLRFGELEYEYESEQIQQR